MGKQLILAALISSGTLTGQILAPIINGQGLKPPTANLVAWYRADTPVGADGASVASWPDSSGNTHTATQGTGARQPIISTVAGRRVVRFSGSQVLSIPTVSLAANNYALYIIGRQGQLGTPTNQLGFGGATLVIQQPSSVTNPLGYINFVNGGTVNSTVGVPLGAALWGGRVTGNRKVVINGHADTIAGTGGAGTSGSGLLGAYNTGGSYGGYMDVFDVLIYNAGSDATLAAIQTYAATKYGINYTPTKQVVYDGNSLTAGSYSTGSLTYPQQAMDLLGSRLVVGRNVGIGAYTTTQLIAGAAAKVDALYSAVTYGKNILVVWEIRNDYAAGQTAAQCLANMATYVAARKSVGWTVVTLTVLPTAGIGGTWAADRVTMNAALVANAGGIYGDAIVDVAADPRLSDNSDHTYYYTDNVHLNNVGYGVVASLVEPVVAGLL